ncbi:MAG: metal ABC transporter substrate-binding protein [Treponema sp.]|nr:metal ABC transporter substrate-binding protein [Treponema sp.]
MKKLCKLPLFFISFGLLFSSCTKRDFSLNQKVKIVCTIFPQYDWVQQILGHNVDNTTLSMIVKSGTNLHNFQPTESDLNQIKECSLFIFTGGESEQWAYNAIANSTNPDLKVINLKELASKNNLINSGDSDEHLWLSLKMAVVAVEEITKQLCQLDPQNQDAFIAHSQEYVKKLKNLDDNYQQSLSSTNAVVLADKFPFYYLAKDYNLTVFYAIPDCSHNSKDTSEETLQQLAQTVEELNLSALYKLDSSSDKIAKIVAQNTSRKHSLEILSLDSMESTTLNQAFNGKTYLQTMEKNLQQLCFSTQSSSHK